MKINRVNLLNYLLIGVILFVSLFLIIPVWLNTILSVFNGSIFQEDKMMLFAKENVYIHSRLLTIGLLLTMLCIAKKNLTLLSFGIIFILGFFVNIYEYMDNYVHPFLFNIGLYDLFLRADSKELNPQYTRVLLYSVLYLILFATVLFNKKRTMDRVFVLLISSTIIITTIIFHVAIPMGYYKYAKNEKTKESIELIYKLPLEYSCNDKNCHLYDKYFKKIKSYSNENNEKEYLAFIKKAEEFFKDEKNKINPIYTISGDFIGLKNVLYICLSVKENYMCLVDNQIMKLYGKMSELWFSFLTGIAHFIWIVLGASVLFMHKKRVIQKIITR